jgi:hypothetical protein
MPSRLEVLRALCFLLAALALPLAAQTGPVISPFISPLWPIPNSSVTGSILLHVGGDHDTTGPGIWHPVVGSGGAYETTGPDGSKLRMEVSIVGKEDLGGKTGYWLETAVKDPKGGEVYFKDLMISASKDLAYAKRVMQRPGQDAIEFDMSVNAGERMWTLSDIRGEAELVGTETISVPAGTFACEHYRLRGGWGDAWVSDKVSPWGLVKMSVASLQGVPEYYTDGRPPKNAGPARGKDSSTVRTKIITDATDHITGTPTIIGTIK